MGSLVSDPPRDQSNEALALQHAHPCLLALPLPPRFPHGPERRLTQSRSRHRTVLAKGPASAPPGPRSPQNETVLRNEKRAERTGQVEGCA